MGKNVEGAGLLRHNKVMAGGKRLPGANRMAHIHLG